jgi:pentatricopeptide repeat protein
MYFEFFCNYYGPIPSIEHCICMIDLLGRAGHVEKAVKLTQEMPYDQGILVWQIVLGACRKSGNVQLGLLAFQHALHLDERNGAAHICMFNIYADATFMQDESCKHAWG